MQIDIGKQLAFELTDEQIDKMWAFPAVRSRMAYIALRNVLMDSHAGQSRDKFNTEIEWRDASKAMAEKTLAAMMEGRVREKGTTPRVGSMSPLLAECVRMAKAAILPMQKDSSQMQKWAESFGIELGDGKAVLIEAIKRYSAKPAVQKLAQKNIDAKAALVTDDLVL
jgi:hypothetical protein